MQIQVTTDNHIQGSAGLTEHVEAVVVDALDRFGDRVTRIDVHLGDENSHKHGGQWCTMEAKLAGLPPAAATAQAETLDQAISAAADKLLNVLDHSIGKNEHPKRHTHNGAPEL